MEESWAWNLGVPVLADGPLAVGMVVEPHTVCLARTWSRAQSQALMLEKSPGSLPWGGAGGNLLGPTPLAISKAPVRAASGPSTSSAQPFNTPRVPPRHLGHFQKGRFLDLEAGLLNQDPDGGALESALTSSQGRPEGHAGCRTPGLGLRTSPPERGRNGCGFTLRFWA